jgi:alpha-D-xyloside xylohydrolase
MKKVLVVLAVVAAMVLAGAWVLRAERNEITVAGPLVKVTVAEPFDLKVEGEAKLERLDENRIRLTAKSGNIAIALKPGEAIFGLTERLVDNHSQSESEPQAVGQLNLRGEVVTMWVSPTMSAYSPFYTSSAGYGMLVEGTRPGIYDIGKTEPGVLRLKWDIGDQPFSAVFFRGPTYAETLDRYTTAVGRPILPPKWVFAPWKWRDECPRYVYGEIDGLKVNGWVADDINMYRKLGLPAGVYLIDRPWAEGENGFGNFNWDEKRFPNGDAMVKKLHELGWRVVVWGAPWAIGKTPSEFGSEAQAKGYKVSERELDLTNPEVVAWHIEKIKQFLTRSGVDGWKLDRGEETNPSQKGFTYHDGRDGHEVHNDYPRLYIRTYYDATRAVRGDDFVLVPRAAYTGTQSMSVLWGGDHRSTPEALRSAIIGVQRVAMMGYPVWGSDTGGYTPIFRDLEVFGRWISFSAFCPLMEIGGVGPHEPWAMPSRLAPDPALNRTHKRFTWVHARLSDYTYSLAQRAHETGNPIVHPLAMDWPADPKAVERWDEFMYGPSLLVAPVWQKGLREREVYLPAGEWIDLWDRSKKFTGPQTLTAAAPIDRIPVFIKADEAGRLPANLTDGI